jgi:hypothetical protein
MTQHETMTMTTIDAIEERLRAAVLLTRRVGYSAEPHELALMDLYEAERLLDAMIEECQALAAAEVAAR